MTIAQVVVGWFAYRRLHPVRLAAGPSEPVDRAPLRLGIPVVVALLVGVTVGPSLGVPPWAVVLVAGIFGTGYALGRILVEHWRLPDAQLGYLLGGSILIETVFAWPGTGFLLNTAIFQRDLPLLQGTILVLALFFVGLNLIVDVLQTALDPRVERR